MIYLDLIFNLSLLVALSVVSGFINQRWPRQTRIGALMQGALFGSATVVGMLHPFILSQGLIFDGRSVLLSLCALFFGPWSVLITAPMTIACRFWLGGGGMATGVLVILSSVGIGLIVHFRRKPQTNPPSIKMLYLFGIAVHIAMLIMMLAMPVDAVFNVLKHITLPVMLLYPLATILVGKILSDQESNTRFMEDLKSQRDLLESEIIERKRAEEALHKSEEMYRTLVQNANEAIYVVQNEKLVFVNAMFTIMAGKNEPELIGKSIYDFIPPEAHDTIREHHSRLLRGEVNSDKGEFRARVPNDTERWMFINAVRIIWDGQPATLNFATDITEHKLAEKTLQESEALFRSTFENHSAVKLLIDPDTGNILEANQAAVNYYGWTKEQLKQMQIQNINTLSPEEVKNEIEKVKNIHRTYFEFRHRRADGSVRDVAVFSSIIATKGKEIIHSIIHDITERKQAEEEKQKLQEQLAQSQKLESIGRLAGGVAHDFNNMLSVILGHTEIAMQQMDAAQPLYSSLMEIQNAAERSAELTRQLLAFARKQTVAPQVLNLNELVEGMFKMLQMLIGEDIHIDWKPETSLWFIRIDPSQIDQILVNLCVNARDAITDVGNITIETGNVSLDEDYCRDHAGFTPGEYVHLTVSDNGCGMDKETLANIFEPFFTTKVMGKGTGLGLATVYGIVKQNNSFINVNSEPGHGASITIYFPRSIGKTKPVSITGTAGFSVHGQETILLVEDEPAILRMTTRMLEKQGYTVLATSSPSEAIRLAQENSGEIQLLMTDVIMPEMNGRDLARKLMALYPNLKRLFMSGYTANIIAEHGILEEGMHFIQKPFLLKDLSAKLRDILDNG